MAVDVRLEGGPRDGVETHLEDENHLAIAYPGYTPVAAQSDPKRGLIMLARWSGSEADEAAYQGPVLNAVQVDSQHDHSAEDAEDHSHQVTDDQAVQTAHDVPAVPAVHQEGAQAAETEQVEAQETPAAQEASPGLLAPHVPDVPQAPA